VLCAPHPRRGGPCAPGRDAQTTPHREPWRSALIAVGILCWETPGHSLLTHASAGSPPNSIFSVGRSGVEEAKRRLGPAHTLPGLSALRKPRSAA
jgi:hypothetical protein